MTILMKAFRRMLCKVHENGCSNESVDEILLGDNSNEIHEVVNSSGVVQHAM